MRRLRLAVLTAGFLGLATGVHSATFPVVEGPGCDPAFHTSMSAAAELAGQREVEIAEKLILKADSVLQYTCFNSLAAAHQHGTVAASLGTYIGSNFSKGSPGGGAICVGMATIWHTMKCRDFDINDFMTYAELVATDPRTTYEPCNSGTRAGVWNNAMTTAFPPPQAAPAAPATGYSYGGMDTLATHNTEMWAGNCANVQPRPISPSGPHPSQAGATFQDMVCPQPGCFYDPATNACRNQP